MPVAPALVRLRVRDDSVYITHGNSVLCTQRDGWLEGRAEQGLLVHETRLLSRYVCRLNGTRPTPVALSHVTQNSWLGYYIVAAPGHEDGGASLTAPDGAAQQSIELRVSRVLGDGLHEDMDVTNFTQQSVQLQLALEVDGDFADQDETAGKREQFGTLTRQWAADAEAATLTLDYRAEHRYDVQGNQGLARLHRALQLRIVRAGSAAQMRDGHIVFDITLAPQASWHACLLWQPLMEERLLLAPVDCHGFDQQRDATDEAFLADATQFSSAESETLSGVVIRAAQQARRDLLDLRMPALDTSAKAWTVAAGVPMYASLFGRDPLTAAWEAALLGPEVMRGTLPVLAARQGKVINDWRDEQPGRMLHEAHDGPAKVLNYNPKSISYGALTASGFFPFVAAQLWFWTGDKSAVEPFIEPALKSLAWMASSTDEHGFVQYKTRSEQGVRNQGWKDSGDAIVYADGRQVAAPIAPCEEQGILYAARLNLAAVLWWFGRRDEARQLFRAARELKRRFNATFWMEPEGCFAMALDARGELVRSIGSNVAHCVATGIVDKARVPRVLDRLFAEDMYSGWGLRTLSSLHPAYNPYSYHRGTVWPVEHGPFAVGAYRYGCHERVEQICRGMFEAAALFESCRLPECFSGHARDALHPFPALYPAANSPQAWSATTVFTLLQALFGLQPFAPLRMLFVDPHMPTWLPEITLRGLRVGDAVVDLRFFRKADGGSDYAVLDSRGGRLHVVRQPSPWSLTAHFGERAKDLALSIMPGR
ncbi:MAG: glycogen debranching N-terminal domain-containing protein [Rhodanobacter sp.]